MSKTKYRKIMPQPGPKTVGAIECNGVWYWRHTRHTSCTSLEVFGKCPYSGKISVIQSRDSIWRWVIR